MSGLRMIDAAAVHGAADYPALVGALGEMYRRGCEINELFRVDLASAGGTVNNLLLRPAWQRDRHIGVKLVTVFPDNNAKGLPSVMGVVVLIDGTTGEPLACIDGTALTLYKTAANSALGACYLAREQAETMLMVGAGALAPHLIRAHAAVRPVRRVTVWNRTTARAEALAAEHTRPELPIAATADLEGAARGADVISCATMARQPLIRGAWLKPGAHLDLVGGYTPEMRETDDEAMRRARIYVDTREGTLREVGDIAAPLAAGVISEADIEGDLTQLARGEVPGRRTADEITVFKNGGGSNQDLAVAQFLAARVG
ncbi:MAG: ornithine cyclodeaminase family protein [Alphaproteobacteria bacterium]